MWIYLYQQKYICFSNISNIMILLLKKTKEWHHGNEDFNK